MLSKIFKNLPAEIDGWKKSTAEAYYTPKNLYSYIDGGAELYLSFNFKKLLTVSFLKEGFPDITVDIFDMGTSSMAFGVFTHSRETEDSSFGQGSEYANGLLTFWKNNYYVSLLAYPETDEKRKTIFALAEVIAHSIPHKGPLPPIISLLPKRNLIGESIRYFNHYLWLNSYCYISDENILFIDKETDALLAKYGDTTGTFLVLLIEYVDNALANAAYKNFLRNYLPHAKRGIQKLKETGWAGCKVFNNLIAIVINAKTQESIDSFFKKITKEIGGHKIK